MRNLLLLSLLGASVCAMADDADMRAKLQAKYDAVDAAMAAGDLKAMAKFAGNSFVATDLQKRTQGLASFLNGLAARNPKKLSIKTRVESADTLDSKAKAALRITMNFSAVENGKTVTYQIVKTEEDTWFQVGDDWKLVGARLTSNLVVRNNKTVTSESEHVLTDWDRHYRRRSSGRRD